MDIKREYDFSLIDAAIRAREFSYSPYSCFKVGAALYTASGSVYVGCNIENAAYSPSVCAERVAFYKAVSERVYDFEAIAVAGWRDGNNGFAFPCGVCRQVFAEFCGKKNFRVLVTDGGRDYLVKTLAELLPDHFGPKSVC